MVVQSENIREHSNIITRRIQRPIQNNVRKNNNTWLTTDRNIYISRRIHENHSDILSVTLTKDTFVKQRLELLHVMLSVRLRLAHKEALM